MFSYAQRQSDPALQYMQQQMKQELKATQQIYCEQLKREDDDTAAKAHLEAMFDTLCWGEFDISVAELPAPAEKCGNAVV